MYFQKVTIPMCMGVVNNAIHGTPLVEKLKNGVCDRRWVTRFARRNGLVVKSGRPCEERRAAWGKSWNLLTHFNQVAVKLVSIGAAVENPDYDPDVPYSEPIFVTQPHR
jgi:hypothetical protein